MALNYDYDEGSETWPFFVLTILLMVLVPLSISQLFRLVFSKNSKSKNSEVNDELFEELNEEYTSEDIKKFREKFEHRKTSSNVFSVKNLIIIIGWCLVAFLIKRIMNNDAIQESAHGMFDPYDLLGISTSASERDIKSAYRKLSVKFHPDKLPKELTEIERTAMEEAYVQITKAYEALTDELVRSNYLKYGHPDGPQSTSHGIALPSFLVDTASSPILVLIYVLSFVLLLPLIVKKWWTKTQSYTKKGIHAMTASYFVDRLVNYKPSEIVTVDLILKWISNAEEFKQFYPHLTPKDFEHLLHDHINRKSSNDAGPGRNEMKYRIVAKSHSILHGLLDISTGFRNTEVASVTLDTFKCIVQAVPNCPNSQIYQLPNVDREHFVDSNEDIHTIGKLFTFEDQKIGKILGIKDEKKLKQTLKVASEIPFLKVLRADFIVPGEPFVTPSSTPHISLKVLVRSAKHKIIPTEKFPAEMMKESQEFEDLKDPFAKMLKQPALPYSFAPYFPAKRRNAWVCLIGLQKDNKLIQTPITVTKLSMKNLNNNFDKKLIKNLDENFKPEDWEIGTIKVPLGQQAPAEPGNIFFRVILKSTDYFGSDLDLTMMMQIKEPSKEEIVDETYENDSESDYDSEDDGENEGSDSDYTDIDTDTEVEEDAI